MTEKKPLVSVIIPVYNVEKYLSCCLDSVLSQTYREIEIWLVDDGSTDGSGAVCDEYASKDDRVTVIHQENRGLSGARTAGLAGAQGEYICFVDSDDCAHPRMIECLIEAAQSHGASAAKCRFERIPEEVRRAPAKAVKEETARVLSAEEMLRLLVTDAWIGPVWAAVYKRELLEGLLFEEGVTFEDIPYVPQVYARADRIDLLEMPLYYYREVGESISRKPLGRSSTDYCEAKEKRLLFLMKAAPSVVNEAKAELVNEGFGFYARADLKKAEPHAAAEVREQVLSLGKKYALPVRTILGMAIPAKWKFWLCAIKVSPRAVLLAKRLLWEMRKQL